MRHPPWWTGYPSQRRFTIFAQSRQSVAFGLPEEMLHVAPAFLTEERVAVGAGFVVLDQRIDRDAWGQDSLQIEHLPMKIVILLGTRTDEARLQSACEAPRLARKSPRSRRGGSGRVIE